MALLAPLLVHVFSVAPALEGDARKVFALMKHGVTNVRIRVDDGSGIPWQIGVEPVVPGQPDLDGACS